jgi:Kazal-type serine protease inhibitor domain
MKFSSTRFALVSVLTVGALALSGCASSNDAVAPADGEEDVLDAAESDLKAVAGAGYFIVTRHDDRRCVSPLCGGVFVKKANLTKTRCADGTLQTECYVGSFDYSPVGFSSDEVATFGERFGSKFAVVKATMRVQNFNGNKLGQLRVTEAWNGAADVVATGGFYRIADNGIRCITTPCPSTSATELNRSNPGFNIIDTNLTNVSASQADLDAAGAALGTKEGILAAGGIATPRCAANAVNCGPFFSPENFYLRVKHQASTVGNTCGTRGAGPCGPNEFCDFPQTANCGRADAPGKCATRPQFCAQVFQPVCGCDGQTYSNACVARSHGVSPELNTACP